MNGRRGSLQHTALRYVVLVALFVMHVGMLLIRAERTSAQALDPRCSNRAATGRIVCVIDEPNVKAHETVYPLVQFAPGDMVDVVADGCVQTGGVGDTWKRYVNPTPNDGLYHGLIRIPSARPAGDGLVRVEKVIGIRQTVSGDGLALAQLVLHLGYEDDGYGDNGYYRHDDGNDDQCKNDHGHGGPAQVRITIYRGEKGPAPTSRFDFDVLSDTVDANGLPYDPQWSWQQRAANVGNVPDPAICHNFSERHTLVGIPFPVLSPNFPDCTDQTDPSNVDLPTGLNAEICNVGGIFKSDSFSGHVDWFPITLEGHAGWGGEETDDDNSFTFTSDRAGNPLGVVGHPTLHVEFDSDETTKHFASDEWTTFHTWVDTNEDALARQLFDGHTIISGMFGLDGEHNLKSEIHPLFAMATKRDNYGIDAMHEDWLIFVRNRGDEGFCSSRLWDSGFEDYTFRLPWLAGMSAVDVDWDATQFEGTDGTFGPAVSFVAAPARDAGVYVTFHLGPAAKTPYIDGALKLVWTPGRRIAHPPIVGGPPLVGRIARLRPGPAEDETDETEHRFASAQEHLTAAQQRSISAAGVSAVQALATHRLARGGPVRRLSARPVVAVNRSHRTGALNAGPATSKLQRDAARIHALCTATHNAPPGLAATACKPPA